MSFIGTHPWQRVSLNGLVPKSGSGRLWSAKCCWLCDGAVFTTFCYTMKPFNRIAMIETLSRIPRRWNESIFMLFEWFPSPVPFLFLSSKALQEQESGKLPYCSFVLNLCPYAGLAGLRIRWASTISGEIINRGWTEFDSPATNISTYFSISMNGHLNSIVLCSHVVGVSGELWFPFKVYL